MSTTLSRGHLKQVASSSSRPHADEEDPLAGYYPVDARAVFDGDLEPPRPELLRRTDGQHLLYRGKRHWLQGEPESGKSWIAIAAVAELVHERERVVYLDWESDEFDVIGRLKYLGVTRSLIGHLDYIHVPGPLTREVREFYDELFVGASLVVFDACAEAMGAEGLDPEKNAEVEEWANRGLPGSVRRARAAYIVIDHVVKDRESRGRYAIGAQHKLQTADVTYSVRILDAFAPGSVGKAALNVEKDRPGGVRRFAVDQKRAAVFVLDATDETAGTALFGVPTDFAGPTRRMDEIIDLLRKSPEPRTKRAIRDLVGGHAKTTAEAIERLILDGRLVKVGTARGYPTYAPATEDA